MNLEMFVREAGSIFAIALIVAGYVGFVFVFTRLVENIFGWKVSRRVFNIIGLPILVVVIIAGLFWHTVTWPWRFRNRRLLREWFLITDDGLTEFNQILVDKALSEVAADLDELFDRQERERKLGVTDPKTEKKVGIWKEKFWNLHRLAKKCGFSVRKKYSDYLWWK